MISVKNPINKIIPRKISAFRMLIVLRKIAIKLIMPTPIDRMFAKLLKNVAMKV
jgi:hypothetical protein